MGNCKPMPSTRRNLYWSRKNRHDCTYFQAELRTGQGRSEYLQRTMNSENQSSYIFFYVVKVWCRTLASCNSPLEVPLSKTALYSSITSVRTVLLHPYPLFPAELFPPIPISYRGIILHYRKISRQKPESIPGTTLTLIQEVGHDNSLYK